MPLDRALSLTLALLIGSALVPNSSAANLAYSTYLKDGFTPKAMVSASRANPARLGSVVSFYVHGIGSPGCFCFGAAVNTQSAAVVNVVTVNSFLTRADVQIPTSFATGNKVSVPATLEGSFQTSMSLYDGPVGPLGLPLINVVNPTGAPGQSLPLVVWATQ